MLKGIFFDFDGVITLEKQGTPPMIAYIAETTGLPRETVEKAYRRHNRALLMGEKTHADMWQQFCEELETDIDYGILKGAFLNITLDQSVVAYIRELKEKYLIGMITDNKVDRIETILKEKGLDCDVSGIDLGNRYIQHGAVDKLYEYYGLSAEKIAQSIKGVHYGEK